jgi:hypothetical protein
MSSSLARVRLSLSVPIVRFNRGAQTMFHIGTVTSDVWPWAGIVGAVAFILFVAILV